MQKDMGKLKHHQTSDHVAIEAELSLKILKEDDFFVAYCSELDLSSHGETVEEAQKNFGEVLNIFFEEITKKGTLDDVLLECGWQKVEDKEKHIPKWIPPAYVLETTVPLKISF